MQVSVTLALCRFLHGIHGHRWVGSRPAGAVAAGRHGRTSQNSIRSGCVEVGRRTS
jgi:hypothetical protein